MAMNVRSRARSVAPLVAASMLSISLLSGLAAQSRSLDAATQDPAGQDAAAKPGQDPQVPGKEGGSPAPSRKARSKVATPKKSRRSSGKSAAGAEKTNQGDADSAKTNTGDSAKGSPPSGISFKNDVAPILVANCVGCHSQGRPGLVRGKLELTSFAKLIQGAAKEKVIEPGKPDESHLVLRVKGEETPRMPQGGNNNGLSEAAIGKIEQWIKAGALLDAGLDPKAALETYAASPEQVRRGQIAKLSPKERDQKIEATGRDRWKKTNPKLAPELTPSGHFLLFSNLPKDRAANTVKMMEAQYTQLKRILGDQATDWVEKVSLYVFNDRKDFVEFIRSVESREVDASITTTGNLSVPQPYVAVADPQGGRNDDPAAAKRKSRTRKGDEKETGGERSLAGLLTESLGEAAVTALGKSPRWLAYGLGAVLAAQVEPRAPYVARYREIAREKYRQGWLTRATEVLGEGEQASNQDLHGVGFAIVDALLSPDLRASFPAFVQGMSKGKEKLDDVLRDVYQANREEFLNRTGDWVAQRYGRDQ
jgi:Planctomycete cytochrome C